MTDLLRTVLLSLLLLASQLTLIRGNEGPNHTCQSDDECRTRLEHYPAYNFVCCTTVLCDENYGNYYFVHSGCSTAYNCKTDVRNGDDGTRFSARLPKLAWNRFEGEVLTDCPKTRQRLAGVDAASIDSAVAAPAPRTGSASGARGSAGSAGAGLGAQPAGQRSGQPGSVASSGAESKLLESLGVNKKSDANTPGVPAEPVGGAQFQLDLGRCPGLQKTCESAGQTCCVLVECRDTLQTLTTYYNLDEKCVLNCPLFITNVGTTYKFYIPPEVWARRGRYQVEEQAPMVTASCRETRYFFYWAQAISGNNQIDEKWRRWMLA